MRAADEIKALREEIARLRERIAVLESKQPLQTYRPVYGPGYAPTYTPGLPPVPWEVTCATDTGPLVVQQPVLPSYGWSN